MSEPQGRPNRPPEPATPVSRRYWLPGADPAWGFMWKGLVPVAALAGLGLYAVTAFAARTEERVADKVRHVLLEQGYTWVTVQSDGGQTVNLVGHAPSQEAAQHAEALARQTRCETWAGALPCVTAVNVSFAGVEPGPEAPVAAAVTTPGAAAGAKDPTEQTKAEAADVAVTSSVTTGDAVAGDAATTDVAEAAAEGRWYALRAVRTSKALRLTGEVPSKEVSSTLVQAAKDAVPATLAVRSALTLTEGAASPGWEEAAKRLIDVVGKCTNGRADISSGKLEVNCEVADKKTRDELQVLSQQPLGALEMGKLNLLVLEEVTACEEALGKLLRRSQIRFATGSASLLPSSRPLLREIASQLKDCPGIVVVEGHTDAQGVREQNIELSENRAKAVVRVLKGAGVPADRVRAEGFGPDRPLATNETGTGRAQNRRIEFRVARSENSGE